MHQVMRKQGVSTKEKQPDHYPSWMALLEAWRCAKKLSEEVHGVLSCPFRIGFPLVYEHNQTFWFDPGPDSSTKEDGSDGSVYLLPGQPNILKPNSADATLKKYKNRSTKFIAPATPHAPEGAPVNRILRACECDFITTQARAILYPNASVVGMDGVDRACARVSWRSKVDVGQRRFSQSCMQEENKG
jgi:hypothetical protein